MGKNNHNSTVGTDDHFAPINFVMIWLLKTFSFRWYSCSAIVFLSNVVG